MDPTRFLLEIWLGRGADGIEPAADIDLGVGFSAEMPGSIRVRVVFVPAEHCELNVAALNYEPVHRVVGDRTADFASEFLKRGHDFIPLCNAGTFILNDTASR